MPKPKLTPMAVSCQMNEALDLAALGYHVFPVWWINPDGSCGCGGLTSCGKGDNAGKHPVTPRGVLEATANANAIRTWWGQYPEANIGVATGEKSGFIVLDIDGPKGRKSLAKLNVTPLPVTVTVTTGREDGGKHYWFKHPGYKVKNSIKKLGAGLDIRGDGGYVIVPPSRHVSGKSYEWGNPDGIDPDALAELPEGLAKLIQAAPKTDRLGFTPIIPEGERDDTLFREGSKLRGLGWGEDAIYAALAARNATGCRPPLQDEQVRKLAKQAASFDPNPVLENFHHSDVGNAKRLIALHGNDIRYSQEQKSWYFWDGSRWRLDRVSRVRSLAQQTISETHDLAQRLRNTNLENWAIETEKRNGIGRMIQEAQPQAGISVTMDELDSQPWLFNVRNGTIDLTTGELFAHNPKQLITMLAPVEFDPDATAPTWERFLQEVFTGDTDLIAYVQRVFGYMLTGETNEQAFFVAYGGGANGKSTMLNTVRRLLGDYGATTPFTTFDADNRNQYGNDVAALKGKRGVIAIESEQERKIAEARVKSITGGEAIGCRFLYGEFFEYIPTYKLWLAVNHKPTIRGTERGIWRRIKLIPFTQNFEGREDRTLDRKLAAEFPGILNWMLAGLREWQRLEGLAEPDAVKFATEEYRKESDTLGEWIAERCEVEQEATTSATALFKDYQQWSDERGETRFALGHRSFGIQLGERGFTRVRTNKGAKWLGVKLQPVKLTEKRGN